VEASLPSTQSSVAPDAPWPIFQSERVPSCVLRTPSVSPSRVMACGMPSA
jgi:hypothetical protein